MMVLIVTGILIILKINFVKKELVDQLLIHLPLTNNVQNSK